MDKADLEKTEYKRNNRTLILLICLILITIALIITALFSTPEKCGQIFNR